MKEQPFAHEKSIAPGTQANCDWRVPVVGKERLPVTDWGALARDFEMLHSYKLLEKSWQKQPCTAHWHYNQSIVENHACHNASSMIPLLMNIVRIYATQQLSVPRPGTRETDSDEVSFPNELVDWQQFNSVAVKGARNWVNYDDGHETQIGPMSCYKLSNVKINSAYTCYSTKEGMLLDVGLGWHSGRCFVIRSLSETATTEPLQIRVASLLKSSMGMCCTRTAEGSCDSPVQMRGCDPCSSRIIRGFVGCIVTFIELYSSGRGWAMNTNLRQFLHPPQNNEAFHRALFTWEREQ